MMLLLPAAIAADGTSYLEKNPAVVAFEDWLLVILLSFLLTLLVFFVVRVIISIRKMRYQ